MYSNRAKEIKVKYIIIDILLHALYIVYNGVSLQEEMMIPLVCGVEKYAK